MCQEPYLCNQVDGMSVCVRERDRVRERQKDKGCDIERLIEAYAIAREEGIFDLQVSVLTSKHDTLHTA